MASNPSTRHRHCIDCGKSGRPGAGLSYRGLCVDCALRRQTDSIRQMAEKSGPYYDQWLESMTQAIGRELADAG